MLNWGARYFPIIRILKEHDLFDRASLLEIGCGPIGIGRFRNKPFVGCDLSFPFQPRAPMMPIRASAAELPAKDGEFDAVLASDILEHIPPELRMKVISESLRVARKLVIFAFPCGAEAWNSDKSLLDYFHRRGLTPPAWLTEHMAVNFPDTSLFDQIDGWEVRQHGNENIAFHSWLMRREVSKFFVRVSSLCMRMLPGLFEALLRQTDRAPFYRQIVVLRKL
jgi:hypothetical protein